MVIRIKNLIHAYIYKSFLFRVFIAVRELNIHKYNIIHSTAKVFSHFRQLVKHKWEICNTALELFSGICDDLINTNFHNI